MLQLGPEKLGHGEAGWAVKKRKFSTVVLKLWGQPKPRPQWVAGRPALRNSVGAENGSRPGHLLCDPGTPPGNPPTGFAVAAKSLQREMSVSPASLEGPGYAVTAIGEMLAVVCV